MGVQNSIDNIQFVTISTQRFTANGTYTPTSGMKFCIVEIVGGAGGAGGAVATSAGEVSCGGGGAGGGYIKVLFTAAQIGASKAVVIGAGGAGNSGAAGSNGSNSTFGSTFAVGEGGDGGAVTSATTSSAVVSSAAGGSTSSGGGGVLIVSQPGERGSGSFCNATGNDVLYTGKGGGSHWGTGAPYLMDDAGIGNNSPIGFGSGAKGNANAGAAGARTGTAGNDGLCVITEFL